MDWKALFNLGDLRKSLGGKLEEALNKLVDESVMAKGKTALKAEGYKLVDGLVDKHYDDLLLGLHAKVKGWIDAIDGEVDQAAQPSASPEAAAPQAAPQVPAGM